MQTTALSDTIPPDSATLPRAGARAVRRVFDRVLVVLFVMAIAIPLAGTWRHWDTAPLSEERRQLAELPDRPGSWQQAKSYLPGLQSYYRDHFGLRNVLINSQMQVQEGIAGVSPNPRRASGEQGWIFWFPPSDPDEAIYRGVKLLTAQELDDWQKMFETRQAALAERHIPLLVLFAPDKQTIYPEYLPAAYKKIHDVSRLDQLMDRMRRTNSPVHMLDLRPPLLQAKPIELLYYKGDTHWNDFGAFVAYRAIMQEIGRILPDKQIVILGPEDFQRFPDERRGDIPDVRWGAEKFRDHPLSMTPRVPISIPVGPHDYIGEFIHDNPQPRLPRLVMYRDSFAVALLPMMAPCFSHGVYIWGYGFDRHAVLEEKPDLVICEFVERGLDDPAPP